jgi:hypothetical protein
VLVLAKILSKRYPKQGFWYLGKFLSHGKILYTVLDWAFSTDVSVETFDNAKKIP